MAGRHGRSKSGGAGGVQLVAKHANREFLRLLRPMWLPVAGAIVALVGLTGVNMATPVLIGQIFSRVFPDRDWALLWSILGALAGLFLVRNLLYYHSKITAMRVGENVCFTLRTRLFERLQQKSLTFTRRQSPGKLTGRIMNDSFLIQQFIQDVLPQCIQAALLFAGVLVMIYVINWQLALAATFVLPLHFIVNRYFGQQIRKTSRRSQENIDFATGNIIEKLLGVEVVKGFTGEGQERRAFREAIEHSRRIQLEGSRYTVLQKVFADLLVCAGMLALLALGARQVIGRPEDQAMQTGEFIAFFWYIRLLYPTVIDLMSSGGKLAKAQASIDRAFELLRDHDEQEEPAGAHLKPELRGEIEYCHVGFRYEADMDEPAMEKPAAGIDVLRDVSFVVPSGSVCAITGPSGSGKTTLVSLLPMLLQPASGSIRIDGVDTQDIDLTHLRRSVGVVFQECFLFNTTIMENLRYARPGLPPKKIVQICKQTGADRFISRLPEGYNSLVGENGINLSRGQKQLITLTRAVIKDPKILILDEATASLDPELESVVVPTILQLMKGRTTLMITHNLTLLRHADYELNLDSGRVTSFKRIEREEDRGAGVSVPRRGSAKLLAMALCLGSLLALPARVAADALPLYQLATQRVRLSYVAPERCISALQLYGFTIGAAGQPVPADKLPVIIPLPSTGHHNSLPNIPGNFPATDADPIGELAVFYHPNHPEQFARVLTLIRRDIDVPARQIMLEAMVLEISERTLNQLGIEWEAGEFSIGNKVIGSDGVLSIGTLGIIPDFTGTANIEIGELFNRFTMTLRALIEDNQAEVLSRPSVLTLDNRMAYINVAELIPIAQTTFHARGEINAISFREREAGIKLAIRPRISEDGEEVSLQVSANVSAVVPGKDEVIRDPVNADRIMAKAPTISVREVQTYARVANNTPFIIGGLISRDDVTELSRVPLLSRIPWLGRAFQSERTNRERREVIIVITPYVLPETEREMVSRNLPLDSDLFDAFDNRLFRDSYRIRAEDVYNLDFILTNQELKRLQAQADAAVAQNADLMGQHPYSHFAHGRFPGEEALVIRQIYSAIRTVGLDRQVDPDRFIFFESVPDSTVSIRVTRLRDFLERTADRLWAEDHAHEQRVPRRPRSVWDAIGDRAIALVYTNRRDDDLGRIFSEPVPEVKILDCAGSSRFDELVWEWNQPDENGLERGAIVLRRERDLLRLQQAVATRETIDLNAPDARLSVQQFQTGRQLLLPRRAADRHDLIDGRTAEIWMITDRYYDVLQREFEQDAQALREALGLE